MPIDREDYKMRIISQAQLILGGTTEDLAANFDEAWLDSLLAGKQENFQLINEFTAGGMYVDHLKAQANTQTTPSSATPQPPKI